MKDSCISKVVKVYFSYTKKDLGVQLGIFQKDSACGLDKKHYFVVNLEQFKDDPAPL